MQLAKEDRDPRSSISSPPLECREVPRKHYLKKELSIMSEDSIMWQPTSEVCLCIQLKFYVVHAHTHICIYLYIYDNFIARLRMTLVNIYLSRKK